MIEQITRCRSLALAVAVALLTMPLGASANHAKSAPHESCEISAQEVVEQFIELFYRQKKVRQAFETWVHPDCIQHKPSLPNGRDPVIVFLEKLLERFPNRRFTIHRVIASDDLVAVHYHSQADPDDLGFAVVDIFRVEDCRMVEHWDVVQPVPAKSANDNSRF